MAAGCSEDWDASVGRWPVNILVIDILSHCICRRERKKKKAESPQEPHWNKCVCSLSFFFFFFSCSLAAGESDGWALTTWVQCHLLVTEISSMTRHKAAWKTGVTFPLIRYAYTLLSDPIAGAFSPQKNKIIISLHEESNPQFLLIPLDDSGELPPRILAWLKVTCALICGQSVVKKIKKNKKRALLFHFLVNNAWILIRKFYHEKNVRVWSHEKFGIDLGEVHS